MAYQSDYMDAPSTPGRQSKWKSWGYHYFKDGLRNVAVDFLEPSAKKPSIIRIMGAPVRDAAGAITDVVPFLQPKANMRLSDPAMKLFAPTSLYEIRCVRYCGPKPAMDEENRRVGPPQIHMIDDWPPSMRKKWYLEGRQPPPTCFDLLLAKAPSIVSQYPKYRKFFGTGEGADFDNALRRPQKFWFLQGLCIGHGKLDCSVEEPLPCIHLLTYSAYESLMELIMAEREGYYYPEGSTHESIATRIELNKRFAHKDLTDPEGAPAVIFTKHENKRRSEKAIGSAKKDAMSANRYVATLTQDEYPLPVDFQASVFTNPEDIFWYPTPVEALDILLDGSPSKDWTDFLLLLARGTDIEPKHRMTQGVDTEDPGEEEAVAAEEAAAGPAEPPAASRPVPALAPVESRQPAQTTAAAGPRKAVLGLGNIKKPNQQAEAVNEEPANMPMPDARVATSGVSTAGAADDPAQVDNAVDAARKRLAAMRQAQVG